MGDDYEESWMEITRKIIRFSKFIFLIFCFIFFQSGCATFLTLKYWNKKEKHKLSSSQFIYSGTKLEFDLIIFGHGNYFYFYLLDLPFSMVMDTVLLPVSIPLEIFGNKPFLKKPDSYKWKWSEIQGTMDWDSAMEKCKGLKMRLPSRDELFSAYEDELMDSWEFGSYWTLSEDKNDSKKAIIIDSAYNSFESDWSFEKRDNKFKVRCLPL